MRANSIYSELLSQGIIGAEGVIQMKLLDVRFKMNEKSAMGNILEEWLKNWMVKHKIYHRPNPNSQEAPDFFLSISDHEDLLEVKAFDHTASANFDIANFDAYARTLMHEAYKLDSDYLIFAYELTNSTIKIRNLWLKKVWELCCPSNNLPLKVQRKQGKIINIRPASWFSDNSKFKPFAQRKDFVLALEKVIQNYSHLSDEIDSDTWFSIVSENYKEWTGRVL